MTLLHLSDVAVRRGQCPVVEDISFDVATGECIGLIGPNGAGKTTLLRAVLGLLPHTGHASLSQMSAAERARLCAWMPQAREIAWPMQVRQLVALGRIAHLPRGARLSLEDQKAVEGALARMGLEHMASRIATRLSGGEQARVLIARALAQDTPLLLADEPIAGLDPAGQIATMQVFADLARSGRSVIVSLHDLGLAARHCTRLILLNKGRMVADGRAEQVLTSYNLREVFGVSAYFEQTKDGPVFQPLEVL